ncbi:MAG: prepilin-type N-terminal cleavage/methylation domain-containing protein [Gammaproteobacteria bacterium]|nr:prepilin-type N-terminal cleavage/methylation domain-containing protein [Gammaproteobacteria bacterium]MDH4253165.1 prepilin-type N-terminal cleavage/methylation domain-containing protein [Gammaproteobacteria bacterium]MDH5308473.1 prepilin-type N-terminal cleavage/methylation domain-containing protein [Gammaproteobacteria bacterium]
MTRHKRRQTGYSLIEVLVAFTILAMALTVLFRIFSSGLRNVDVSADYSQALLVAEGLLAAPGNVEELREGIAEGVAADRFHWTRRISEFQPEGYEPVRDSGVSAYRVEVEVRWDRERAERRMGLATIRLDRPEDGRTARR